jgi:hypothetical protein
MFRSSSLSWSYGGWNYNYMCYQCLSSLTSRVIISLMAKCPRNNITQYSVSLTWCRPVVFFSVTPVSATIKSDHHDIAESLLKVALNTRPHLSIFRITLTKSYIPYHVFLINILLTECCIPYRVFIINILLTESYIPYRVFLIKIPLTNSYIPYHVFLIKIPLTKSLITWL